MKYISIHTHIVHLLQGHNLKIIILELLTEKEWKHKENRKNILKKKYFDYCTSYILQLLYFTINIVRF